MGNERALQDLHEDLLAAVDWVAEHTAVPPGSRLRLYPKLVAELADAERADALLDLTSTGDNSERLAAAFEAVELVDIYKGLAGYEGPGLAKRLADLVSGTFHVNDEAPSRQSHHPRNISFELATAATFAMTGYEVSLEHQADIVFPFCNKTVYVECKRPQTFKGLEDCLKDAKKQLQQRIDADPQGQGLGLIALSINKVANPRAEILVAQSETTWANSSGAAEEFVRRHVKIFKRPLRSDHRIIALDVHVSTLASGPQHSLGVRSGLTKVTHHPPRSAYEQYARQLTADRNASVAGIREVPVNLSAPVTPR